MPSADPIFDLWRGDLVSALYGVVKGWHKLVDIGNRHVAQRQGSQVSGADCKQNRTASERLSRSTRINFGLVQVVQHRPFVVSNHHASSVFTDSQATRQRAALRIASALWIYASLSAPASSSSSQRLWTRSTRPTCPNNLTHNDDDSAFDPHTPVQCFDEFTSRLRPSCIA